MGCTTPSTTQCMHTTRNSLSENMEEEKDVSSQVKWFAMRDLKRFNAKEPAYRLLEKLGIEVFTPKKWHITSKGKKRVREQIALIPDMLFVHSSTEKLDPVVEKTPTLQYRWLRNSYRKPMVVPDTDMERFIHAVNATDSPRFYLPGEITSKMIGSKIRIVGGPLNGYEGHLLSMRGSKKKRLIVEIPNLLTAAVEVLPEFIQLAKVVETQ